MGRSRLRFASLLLALCAVVAAAAQEPVPATYFGMTVQNFTSVEPALTFGTVRTWDAYNGSWDHTPGLDWAHIETVRGIYNFTAVDRFLDWAEKHHAETIYTFGRTPRWASAMPGKPGHYGLGECAAPANLADWDDFVRALALHVHGRVKAWELWNEPNDPESYCGDVPTMVRMASDASRILKQVDARATVLSPGVVSDGGPAWLGRFLAAGGRDAVDVIAFHGYWNTRAEDIIPLVKGYRMLAGTKPLWDTEASWAGRNGGRGGLTDGIERAAFLAKYELLQWGLGVRRFVWYAYDGQEIWGRLWSPDRGLHEDGKAFEQVQQWMLGATLNKPCATTADGLWRCELTRKGWAGTVLWSEGASRAIEVEPRFKIITDLAGRETPGNTILNVGNQPLLLETSSLHGRN